MKHVDENYFRYVPIRQRDVDWGLYVLGVGCTSMPPGYTAYPVQTHPEAYHFTWATGRKLAEYQAIYITRGEGEFESTPTGRREITAGSFFLLFPDVWHRYRPSQNTGWDEYWVSFAGEQVDRLVAEGFFSPNRAVLNPGVDDAILAPYQSLLDRVQGEATGFPHLIAADTMEILAAVLAADPNESAELASKGPHDVATVDDRLVADALRLIWDQSQRTLTVGALARQLPTTRRSLERRFHDALGHTIHEEITRCRLERAKRLLAKTDLSVKEVAAAAGFSSTDNMGRTFQRLEGVSPREHRRQLRHDGNPTL